MKQTRAEYNEKVVELYQLKDKYISLVERVQ